MTPFEQLQRFLRWQEPADVASDQMLNLQLDNLELRFRMIERETLPSDHEKGRYDQIAEVFSTRRRLTFGRRDADGQIIGLRDADGQIRSLTWDDAYRLEAEIGCLLHGDRLREEIADRLRWAIADQVPQAIDLQKAFVELIKADNDRSKISDEVLIDFLLELMEAIHWFSKRKYIVRKLRAQATRRTLSLALIALLIALSPYIFLSSIMQTNARPASLAFLQNADFYLVVSRNEDFWVHFALYTAVTFGFLGALFSRLITLQKEWNATALDELFNARTYHYIVLRASIGVVGALVVYFFLQSGLVKGSVFPIFEELTMNTVSFSDPTAVKWPTKLLLPSPALALLIMWSFIAGFSESLVPTVLANAERQFGGALNARQ